MVRKVFFCFVNDNKLSNRNFVITLASLKCTTLKRHDTIRYIIIALLAVIAIQCANPGTPTGGPKDRKPPVLVQSIPEPNATGFSGDMVTLVFDENIQLKDQNTKFVVSPPMAVQPKLDAHANTVRIRFDSDTVLMPATTYTFDFADCLSDLNESNVLENFTFTFSTGESKDTMMISGNIYDAETITPVSGIYVMLQSNLEDSAFNTVPPIRIAKTDDKGRFAIKNVPAERNYRVYALDDQNRNFLFDQPGEKIAWLSDIITPSYEIRQINDSVRIDSLSQSPDTAEWVYEHILRDTLVYTPDSLIMFSFTEDHYEQYITSDERKSRNNMKLVFNKPMDAKPKFSFPGQNPDAEHAVIEYSAKNDTCVIWVTDSVIYKGDSIVLAVQYPVLDSLKQMTTKLDTLDLWYVEKAQADKKKDDKGKRRRKGEQEKKPEVPTLKMTMPTSVGVYAAVSILSDTPYGQFDWNGVRLTHKVDTIYEPVAYVQIDDTINLKRKALKTDWIAGDEYKLEIDSACIYDIYGLQNDKKESKISVATLDKYGTMYIVIDSVPEHALLQLLNNDKVTRQNVVPANGKVGFKYLKPGDYMVRIVSDVNGNGQWDTGNYEKGIQPEKVVYYMEKVTVRANWDIKVEFNVGMYTPLKFSDKFRSKGGKSSGSKKRK